MAYTSAVGTETKGGGLGYLGRDLTQIFKDGYNLFAKCKGMGLGSSGYEDTRVEKHLLVQLRQASNGSQDVWPFFLPGGMR